MMQAVCSSEPRKAICGGTEITQTAAALKIILPALRCTVHTLETMECMQTSR